MSCRAYDNYLHQQFLRDEYACSECGYRRGEGHHPKIRCPKTGFCGECGGEWPCEDHIHMVRSKEKKEKGQLIF